MPNNTVFSKKILDFFLFLGVFCIGTTLNHSAYADLNSANFPCRCILDTGFDHNDNNCTEYLGNYNYGLTGDTPEEKCKSVQGCKWDLVDGGCSLGSQDKYTDYTVQNCEQTSSCVTPCPHPYTNSAAGSWSIDQCYKDVNCADETEATASDTEPKKCRIYYSGKVVCTSATSTPSCNGIWDTSSNNICDLNQASVLSFTDNDTDNLLSYDYHREMLDGNPVCYFNHRACNLFRYQETTTSVPQSASNNSNNVIITGTAQWNSGYWRVGNCHKIERNENIPDANCTGVTIAQASNGDGDIHNVNDVLVYYDSPQNNNDRTKWQYRCTKCLAGYQAGGDATANGCFAPICSCQSASQGYYSTGGDFCTYDFNENIFNNNNFADNFCSPIPENYVQPCPEPGMTSNGGATSAAQCHYGSGSNGTQFCDAFGCVYLDTLTFDGNGYSWNGDVHLVGVSTDENADYFCPVYPNPPHFWGYDKDGNPINAQGDIVNNCGN